MKIVHIVLCLTGLLITFNAHAQTATLQARRDHGLAREAQAVRRFDLTRLRDEDHLRRAVSRHLLQRVGDQQRGFVLDEGIGSRAENDRGLYRTLRPWTYNFLRRLGAQYFARFRNSFTVTSMTRTIAYQRRLRSGNANAAPANLSSHTTGATLDISWRGMTRPQIVWLSDILLRLERQELVQATREFQQPVFHVMVYPVYHREAQP